MTSAETSDERNAGPTESPGAGGTNRARPKRDWARLIMIHIYVTALTPLVAATLYSIVSPERGTFFTGRGLIAYGALVGCTYAFFGIFAIAGVIVASPVVALFSKYTAPWLGRLLAISVFGIASWFIGSLSDVPAFQIAAAATAALASAKLEHAWRITRLNR
jgi:hypothetical protein